MDQDDKLGCFGCHATDATEGRVLMLGKMTPGVQCERCHGTAEKHASGLVTGSPG